MKPFSTLTEITPTETTIKVFGYINEFAQFPAFPTTPKVIVDTEGVTGMNSVGTRNWCNWFEGVGPSTKILLRHCPIILVKSFNQVKGSYPKLADVESFAVPYYSPSTDEARNVFFNKGTEYVNGKVNLPLVKDNDGNAMDLDVDPQAYFAFLDRRT